MESEPPRIGPTTGATSFGRIIDAIAGVQSGGPVSIVPCGSGDAAAAAASASASKDREKKKEKASVDDSRPGASGKRTKARCQNRAFPG